MKGGGNVELEKCADCGEKYNSKKMFTISVGGNGYICENCFKENYFKCNQCGEVLLNIDKKTLDNKAICKDCYNK